jgi:hypothetical protein
MTTLIPKYDQGGTGAVNRPINLKLAETVSVLDFGADPTGVADSTAAFNLATLATLPSTGIDQLNILRKIYVPAGIYLIAGTVYVRKGQHIYGAGDGTTQIRGPVPTPSTGRVTFKMGFGLINGVEVYDTGGLCCVVSDLFFYGGDAIGPSVDCQVSGGQIKNCFFTSVGTGINLNAGDCIISNCIFDQGNTGIKVTGQNLIISQSIFYLMANAIFVLNATYDVQINDCHFEYQTVNDITFETGATLIKNVSIADCQFTKNAQYVTSDYGIAIGSSNAEIQIRDCDFRNQRGFSVGSSAGTNNYVVVSNCVFNGQATNPAYTQSTTAAGIRVLNSTWVIENCSFINLKASPISVDGNASPNITITGCDYLGCTGVSSFIVNTGSNGSIRAYNNIGDNVLRLIDTQNATPVNLKNNLNWLGAPQVSGVRRYWIIPTQKGALLNVGLTANPLPSGSAFYSNSSNVLAIRRVGNNAGTVTDYAVKNTIYESSDGTVPVLDIALELDSVGGGASSAYISADRNLVISIPTSYTNYNITADYLGG